MSTRNLIISIALLLCLLFSTLSVQAQDGRRVQPAFPIAAGEKMLVIPGNAFSDRAFTPGLSILGSEATRRLYRLELPVGTTLKRLVVEAAEWDDEVIATYMTFNLERIKVRTLEKVVLKSISTEGYLNATEAQFVSSPTNHVMLQGWVYFIEILFAGGGHTQQKIDVVKVIYEP